MRINCKPHRRQRELGRGVIVPLAFTIKETTQSRDLRREEHQDDLHLDIELELEDFFACPQRLRACRHEHVSPEPEYFQTVDHLSEFGTPC